MDSDDAASVINLPDGDVEDFEVPQVDEIIPPVEMDQAAIADTLANWDLILPTAQQFFVNPVTAAVMATWINRGRLTKEEVTTLNDTHGIVAVRQQGVVSDLSLAFAAPLMNRFFFGTLVQNPSHRNIEKQLVTIHDMVLQVAGRLSHIASQITDADVMDEFKLIMRINANVNAHLRDLRRQNILSLFQTRRGARIPQVLGGQSPNEIVELNGLRRINLLPSMIGAALGISGPLEDNLTMINTRKRRANSNFSQSTKTENDKFNKDGNRGYASPKKFPHLNFDSWKSFTSDQFILNTVLGYELPFIDNKAPPRNTYCRSFITKDDEIAFLSTYITSMLEQEIIKQVSLDEVWFLNPIFLVPKRDSYRPILDCRKLNEYLVIEHFQMEDIQIISHLAGKGFYQISYDLEQAYYSVPIRSHHQGYLSFSFEGKYFTYTRLVMGLSTSPYIFTRLSSVVMKDIRSRYSKIIALRYLDDFYFSGPDSDSLTDCGAYFVSLMEALGYSINLRKSVTTPTHRLDHLGFTIDLSRYRLYLKSERAVRYADEASDIITHRRITARRLAAFIGKAISCIPCCEKILLHLRLLQQALISTLKGSSNYNRYVTISPLCKDKLSLLATMFKENIGKSLLPSLEFSRDVHVYTDASSQGWGVIIRGIDPGNDISFNGLFKDEEVPQSINYKELKAMSIGLQLASSFEGVSSHNILLHSDSMVALYGLRNQGTTKNFENQNQIDYILSSFPELQSQHVPTAINPADQPSRIFKSPNDICVGESLKQLLLTKYKIEHDLFACEGNTITQSFSLNAFNDDWRKFTVNVRYANTQVSLSEPPPVITNQEVRSLQDAVKEHLSKQGFSLDMISSLLKSFSQSTYKHYNSAFKKFTVFKNTHPHKSHDSRLLLLLDFLQHLEKTGYAATSIVAYSAAIRSYFKIINEPFTTQEEEMVSRLLTGMRRNVIVAPKHIQLFDVQPILKYLRSVSLKDGMFRLGRKTLFLMMLCSGGRISEYDKIRIRNLQFIEGTVRVNLDIPTKTSQALSFELRPFEDVLLCPVTALQEYISLTSEFREDGVDKFLFLKGNASHGSASKGTLATWIKQVCIEAGIEPINTHMIRKTVWTTLFTSGLSLKELCERIQWKSDATFLKFYNQDAINISSVMLSQDLTEMRGC